ncbi:MAG: hypothetical protein HC882_08745, partial [Acidobacteria bacterium]|nr:hypothetical protein [Acidobacteriota bacterium]
MSSQRVLLSCSLLSLCVLVPPSAADSPVITSVEPAFGFNDEETLITVRGEGFQPGDRVALLDGTGYEFVTLVPTDGESRNILAQDGWLYVADGPAGVRVFDLGDPRQPALVRTVDTPGFATDLAFEGGTLVVADGAGGIQIIDVTDPPRAERSGGLAGLGDATIVAMASGFAYVAAGDRLSVIDARAPEAPEVVASYPFEGAIGALAANADVVFVAHQIPSDSPYRSRWKLDLLSASDPQALRSIGSMNFWYGNPTDLRVEGSVVYVAGINDSHYAEHFIIALDTSIPGPPRSIGSWWNYSGDGALSPAQRQGMRLTIDGESVLLTTCSSLGEDKPGLHVVDLPAMSGSSPGEFVSVSMRPDSCPHSVASSGGYAYLSDTQGGVHVVDMRDRPSVRGAARILEESSRDAIFLLVDRDFLYLGIERKTGCKREDTDSPASSNEFGCYDSHTILSAYDIANPETPKQIGSSERHFSYLTVVAAQEGCFFAQTNYAVLDLFSRNFGSEKCTTYFPEDVGYDEITHLGDFLYATPFDRRRIDAIDIRGRIGVIRGFVDLPGYSRRTAASEATVLVVETPDVPGRGDVLQAPRTYRHP